MRERYFDNASTTPLDPRVLEAMLPFLREDFGNAASIHSLGLRAASAVEHAREQVASLIGAEDPAQITFTSGATESNNWVLSAFDRIAISPFEHAAVYEPATAKGAEVLANDQYRLEPPTSPGLLSVIAVSNETGAIVEPPNTSAEKHSDITQAVGKIPLSLDTLDFASFSGHKFYGPKGIGALYAKDVPPEPLLKGGEQEHGYRAGTLNVPAIVGMGAAARIAQEEREQDHENAKELNSLLLEELSHIDEVRTNGGPKASPFILSISFRGVEGETLVLEMDRAGYAISAGAACSSRSTVPSRVLTALGLEEDWLRGTIRVSFGRFNTKEETGRLAKLLRTSVESLRTMKRSGWLATESRSDHV